MKNGFRFKQFFVAHDECAMKVGTDAIMLGSWVQPGNASRLLDIGTGSGILALMLAQKARTGVQILGIDIDRAAINQAQVNAAASPWGEQLHFCQQSVQEMSTGQGFDLIVSNPPYFARHHQQPQASDSPDRQRQQARQQTTLDYPTLLAAMSRLLKRRGNACLVLPHHSVQQVTELAGQHGLDLFRHCLVHSLPERPPTRALLCFTPQIDGQHSQCQRSQLVIYQRRGEYSDEYRQLCRDYYLHF